MPSAAPSDLSLGVRALIPLASAAVLGGFALFRRVGKEDRVAQRIAEGYSWADAGLADRIVEVAEAVRADPFALANLIQFESGGNPQARNPTTGATGLIQFIPSTASRLGTSTAVLGSMSALGQMDWVERYLLDVGKGRSLKSPPRLAMAVFYPAAMSWPAWAVFPWDVIRANGYRIYTPEDYWDRLAAHSKLPSTARWA